MGNLRKLILVLFFVVLSSLTVVYAIQENYENEELNFSIQFPDDWIVESGQNEYGTVITALSSYSYEARIVIVVSEDVVEGDFRTSSESNLNDFVTGMESKVGQDTFEETYINDLLFYTAHIIYSDSDFESYHYSGVYNDKLYGITVNINSAAKSHYYDEVMECINSFELLNDTYLENSTVDSGSRSTAYYIGYYSGKVLVYGFILTLCYLIYRKIKMLKITKENSNRLM